MYLPDLESDLIVEDVFSEATRIAVGVDDNMSVLYEVDSSER